jgi:hypothetical protein
MKIFGLRIIREKAYQAMRKEIEDRKQELEDLKVEQGKRNKLTTAEIASLLNHNIALERILARQGVRLDDSLKLKSKTGPSPGNSFGISQGTKIHEDE